ncbi:hypothetical protein HDK90DRAFT_527278 [Phyllosticta capitalensis]|uniref:DUF7053 domain-containing protein n=1 Tax=Phyllosticta capitalensis TaxID=121624 RepID=A0ABR1YHP7_9PEZI
MISLNPLVQSYELLHDPDYAALGLPPPPPPPEGAQKCETYRITDALPVAFGGRTWWTGETTYVARFEDGAAGHMATQTRAAWGVSNTALWSLKTRTVTVPGEGEEDVVELTESIEVRVPFFLKPFVKATVDKAHRELREAFVERLRHVEEMKVRRMEREKKDVGEGDVAVVQEEENEVGEEEVPAEKQGETG